MSQEPAREGSGLDRDDIAALHAMAEVHLAATSHAAQPARPDDDAQAVLRQVAAARGSLGQQYAVGPTRFASAKRLILRVSRLWTHHQVAAVDALAAADEQLVRMNLGVLDEAERQVDTVRAQVVATEQALQAGLDTLAEAHGATAASLTAQAEQVAALTEHQARLEAAVAALGLDPTPHAEEPGEYVSFEDRFRGTREQVRALLMDALRFVAPFAGSQHPVLDLGCGRGEWLELLRDSGIPAYGIDLNVAMVEEVVALALDARHANAFDHLDEVEEGSLAAVTAFHLVEHVPHQLVPRLVRSAFRALRPGGKLILETPNPTNLAVGAGAFYLDPTHLRPVHPEYLRFLAESVGFADVEVHFTHPVSEPDEELPGDLAPRLEKVVKAGEWALFGPQDYLLAATKPAVSA